MSFFLLESVILNTLPPNLAAGLEDQDLMDCADELECLPLSLLIGAKLLARMLDGQSNDPGECVGELISRLNKEKGQILHEKAPRAGEAPEQLKSTGEPHTVAALLNLTYLYLEIEQKKLYKKLGSFEPDSPSIKLEKITAVFNGEKDVHKLDSETIDNVFNLCDKLDEWHLIKRIRNSGSSQSGSRGDNTVYQRQTVWEIHSLIRQHMRLVSNEPENCGGFPR